MNISERVPPENCNSCDVCLGTREVVDCTRQAQMVLSAIVRTQERFGAAHIVDIVTGSDTKKIREFGHDQLITYGVGKGQEKKYWRQLLDDLVARKAIAKSEGLYPTLLLLPKGIEILKGQENVEIIRVREKQAGRQRPASPSVSSDRNLFELLRALRKQIADEQKIPPYIVFSDRTLHDMAARLPRDPDAMLLVSGVGEVKRDHYGKQFLDLINRYCDEHGSSTDPTG